MTATRLLSSHSSSVPSPSLCLSMPPELSPAPHTLCFTYVEPSSCHLHPTSLPSPLVLLVKHHFFQPDIRWMKGLKLRPSMPTKWFSVSGITTRGQCCVLHPPGMKRLTAQYLKHTSSWSKYFCFACLCVRVFGCDPVWTSWSVCLSAGSCHCQVNYYISFHFTFDDRSGNWLKRSSLSGLTDGVEDLLDISSVDRLSFIRQSSKVSGRL